MCVVELTVPFETNIVGAAERKAHRYQELASACGRSHHTSIITLEVGSRGYLSIAGFQQLYQLVQAKATDRTAFERDIIRHVVSLRMTFGASGTGVVRFVHDLFQKLSLLNSAACLIFISYFSVYDYLHV